MMIELKVDFKGKRRRYRSYRKRKSEKMIFDGIDLTMIETPNPNHKRA